MSDPRETLPVRSLQRRADWSNGECRGFFTMFTGGLDELMYVIAASLEAHYPTNVFTHPAPQTADIGHAAVSDLRAAVERYADSLGI
jgi:hypothetical protein